MSDGRIYVFGRMAVIAFLGLRAAMLLWPIDMLAAVATAGAFLSVICTYGEEAWP